MKININDTYHPNISDLNTILNEHACTHFTITPRNKFVDMNRHTVLYFI